jgi:hypothetical protein
MYIETDSHAEEVETGAYENLRILVLLPSWRALGQFHWQLKLAVWTMICPPLPGWPWIAARTLY